MRGRRGGWREGRESYSSRRVEGGKKGRRGGLVGQNSPPQVPDYIREVFSRPSSFNICILHNYH